MPARSSDEMLALPSNWLPSLPPLARPRNLASLAGLIRGHSPLPLFSGRRFLGAKKASLYSLASKALPVAHPFACLPHLPPSPTRILL